MNSYLPGCTAFKFCFTWFEVFRNVNAIGHAESLLYDSSLHFLNSSAAVLCLWAFTVLGWTKQSGLFSGSSSVHFIWKVSLKELYLGIAVETAEDWDSGFGTKLWRWAEDIPREWVISLWSHSHHLWVDVEALPSTVLLVIRQRINTAMSGKSDTSPCSSNFILKYWHPLLLHPGGMESLIIKSKCDGT